MENSRTIFLCMERKNWQSRILYLVKLCLVTEIQARDISFTAIHTLLGDFIYWLLFKTLGFPCSSVGKESTCNAGDLGSIPGLGRSPGDGNSYPLLAWRISLQGVGHD